MELIDKYFPDLTEEQRRRIAALYGLYADWNAKINVVSRKDFDQLYLRHVLHSLAIAKVCAFADGARILDAGCGGGFPSVPLAILFPGAPRIRSARRSRWSKGSPERSGCGT